MRSHTRWVRVTVLTLGTRAVFWRRRGNTGLTYIICLFSLSQRGLCSVAQLWTLSEDCCANELSQCADSLHGALHWTVCFLRDRSTEVDLCCHCWHFPLLVTGRNGNAAPLKSADILHFSYLSKNLIKKQKPTVIWSWYSTSIRPIILVQKLVKMHQ